MPKENVKSPQRLFSRGLTIAGWAVVATSVGLLAFSTTFTQKGKERLLGIGENAFEALGLASKTGLTPDEYIEANADKIAQTDEMVRMATEIAALRKELKETQNLMNEARNQLLATQVESKVIKDEKSYLKEQIAYLNEQVMQQAKAQEDLKQQGMAEGSILSSVQLPADLSSQINVLNSGAADPSITGSIGSAPQTLTEKSPSVSTQLQPLEVTEQKGGASPTLNSNQDILSSEQDEPVLVATIVTNHENLNYQSETPAQQSPLNSPEIHLSVLPKQRPINLSNLDSVASSAETAEPGGNYSSSLLKTAFAVDLGPVASIEQVRLIWRQTLIKGGKLVENLSPAVGVRELTSGQSEMRLIAGPIEDAGEVAIICARLVANGQDCLPSIFEGSRVAVP